jgi:hypothetical protein
MYLVNLVSVPQDPDATLTNKVLPEQEGSPLARLLLLAARNKEEGEEDEGRFVSGYYSIPLPAEIVTARNYTAITHLSSKPESKKQGYKIACSLCHNCQYAKRRNKTASMSKRKEILACKCSTIDYARIWAGPTPGLVPASLFA